MRFPIPVWVGVLHGGIVSQLCYFGGPYEGVGRRRGGEEGGEEGGGGGGEISSLQ